MLGKRLQTLRPLNAAAGNLLTPLTALSCRTWSTFCG